MKQTNQIKVLLDTSPLINKSANRGIGTYTRLLHQYLIELPELKIEQSFFKSKKINFRPDIVHYPYFDLFFNTLPINLFKKTKLVVTVHDLIPLKFPKFYPPGIKGKLIFLKQKQALNKADAVITDSFASQKDIKQHLGIKKEKTNVVYLAANPELEKADEKMIKRVKRKFSLPKNYILYVGDINYNKNIPQLIKSVKYLPIGIKLVCLGKNFYSHNIPEWQWIETQLALSDVKNRVKFITNIESKMYAELAAIYTGALCYVQPSLYEGFGLPILEAMQCKTPVVSTKNSSLIEVGDRYVQFAEPTAENLAEAINEVLQWSENKRTKRIEEAYQWGQSFTWKRVAKETLQVYQKILNLPRSAIAAGLEIS